MPSSLFSSKQRPNKSGYSYNYSGGKSFKDVMQRLESTSRKIADSYLHSQIRNSESLPNSTQVKFDSELDFLLAEILRILK